MKVGRFVNSSFFRFGSVVLVAVCCFLLPTSCDPMDIETSGSLINCTGKGPSTDTPEECQSVMITTNNCKSTNWNENTKECIGIGCLSCVLP